MRTPASPHPRRRALLLAAGAGLALGAAGCGAPAPAARSASPPRLRTLGEATLPHRMSFQGTTVGGLSGIDFDAASGTWVALSDDRSDLQPARFYRLRFDITERPLRPPELLDTVTLLQADGQPFAPRRAGGEVVDPEALRLLPQGRLLWTSEGDVRTGQPPTLREATAAGRHVRTFELPPMFGVAAGRGPRDNLGFEGLAVTPDARTAWAAMESALQQDGAPASVTGPGGPCRITAFDIAAGRAVRQIAYRLDPIPRAPAVPGGFADNGISEILMLDTDRMLVLERAFMLGVGNSLRLYEIDTRAADDTLALDRIDPAQVRIADKRLVADFAQLGLARLDNTEALAWGPRLANGRRSLVAVSDDNFNPSQVTQFVAFEFLD